MKPTDAWSDGVPLHADSVAEFNLVYGLSPAAMHRLSLLPEPLTGLFIRSFEPKVDRSDWSERFVAHADAIESAWTYRAMDAHRSPPLSAPWPKRLLRAETSVAPTMLRRPAPSLPEAPPSGVATHAPSAKDEAKLRPSCKHARVHGAIDPSAPIKISGCTTRPSRFENITARPVARLAYTLSSPDASDDGKEHVLSNGKRPHAKQSQRAGQQHDSSDTRPGTATDSHRQQTGAPGTRMRRRSVNAVAAIAGSGSTRSDFPDVHVLLFPGGEHSTAPPCSQGACGTVWVFGFHNSGTHALVEYLTELFDVEVQPPLRSKKRLGDGILHV